MINSQHKLICDQPLTCLTCISLTVFLAHNTEEEKESMRARQGGACLCALSGVLCLLHHHQIASES